MKLLYILPYPRFFTQHQRVGGHIAHCIGILKSFKNRKYSIRYFSEESDVLIKELDIDLKVYPSRTKTYIGRQIWNYKFIKELSSQIKEYQPDLIYMRYSVSICFWYFLIKQHIGNTPLILEVNSLGSQRIKLFSLIEKKFLKIATSVIVISSLLREHIIKTTGIEVNVVPNGIEKERIPENIICSKATRCENGFKMIYTGLLKPSYGLEFIITSSDIIRKKIADLELLIYGDGPLFPVLRELVEYRPWVKLMGPIDFNLVPQKLVSTDLLLYPTSSFNQFGSPTKLFEYMASARPIVAAKTEQTSKLLKGGKLGYLYDLDNVDTLEKAILKVYNNRTVAHKMAKEARIDALANHTWDSRFKMILNTLPDKELYQSG